MERLTGLLKKSLPVSKGQQKAVTPGEESNLLPADKVQLGGGDGEPTFQVKPESGKTTEQPPRESLANDQADTEMAGSVSSGEVDGTPSATIVHSDAIDGYLTRSLPDSGRSATVPESSREEPKGLLGVHYLIVDGIVREIDQRTGRMVQE